jgi:hypothetical protein
MNNNLLIWPNLDSTELRILLHEIIGGMGQADLGVAKPSTFYLPMAGPSPLMVASLNALTNYRRLRKHRDLTLLLNILLVGGTKSMGFRPTHFWAVDPADLSHNSKWVQQGFFAPLGPWIIDGVNAGPPINWRN